MKRTKGKSQTCNGKRVSWGVCSEEESADLSVGTVVEMAAIGAKGDMGEMECVKKVEGLESLRRLLLPLPALGNGIVTNACMETTLYLDRKPHDFLLSYSATDFFFFFFSQATFLFPLNFFSTHL